MVSDFFFFFQAEDGIRDKLVTGVQTCALPISWRTAGSSSSGAPRPRSGASPAAPSGNRRSPRTTAIRNTGTARQCWGEPSVLVFPCHHDRTRRERAHDHEERPAQDADTGEGEHTKQPEAPLPWEHRGHLDATGEQQPCRDGRHARERLLYQREGTVTLVQRAYRDHEEERP